MQCIWCKSSRRIPVKPGISSIPLPIKCERIVQPGETACPRNPYVLIADKCHFIDQQTMKLQESPESVPTGEMPRNILLFADRYLVERVAPGTRVTVVGIYEVFQSSRSSRQNSSGSSVAIRNPYLRILSISANNEGTGRASLNFEPREEEKFVRMAKDPQIFSMIARSIDPAIYGVAGTIAVALVLV